jgi:hypothetical protein
LISPCNQTSGFRAFASSLPGCVFDIRPLRSSEVYIGYGISSIQKTDRGKEF